MTFLIYGFGQIMYSLNFNKLVMSEKIFGCNKKEIFEVGCLLSNIKINENEC